jgi:dienelactone hydrolase
MADRLRRQRDLLVDYTRVPFGSVVDGRQVTRDVFRAPRTGPPVVVLHEAFGLTRFTVGVAKSIQEAGLTPVLPVLVGPPLPTLGQSLRGFARICVMREFGAWARNEATPIATWLRALARHERDEAGGTRVGVIGMCFSGGYALAMALDDAVAATVSSQPAIPFAIPGKRRNLGVNRDDLGLLRERTDDGARVRTLRFQRDPISPGVRCDELMKQLPKATPVEIPTLNPLNHSVLSMAVGKPKDSELGNALEDTVTFLKRWLVADA